MVPAVERWLPDANTILRYPLGDDPALSSRADVFWEAVRNGSRNALLRVGVVLECVNVLQRFYRVPRAIVAEKLLGLIAYKGLAAAEADLLEESLKIYAAENFDFVDSLLAASMARGDGTIFGFDKKLDKRTEGSRC
jgi:predicted nucleic-acid-binding protein